MAVSGPGAAVVIANGNVLRADAITMANDQAAYVSRYYLVGAAANNPTQGDAATILDSFWASLFKALMSPSATYRGVIVRKVWPLPPTGPAIMTDNAGVGTVTGDLLPRQTSGLLTLRTAFAGRKYRGRSYVPFPSEASNDANGIPTAAYVTSLTALAADFVSSHTFTYTGRTASLTPLIYHRATNSWDTVIAYVARQRWATQRRRGSYGRTNVDPTL